MLRTPAGLSGPRQVCVLCQRRAWHRCPKTCLLDRGEYANFFPLPIILCTRLNVLLQEYLLLPAGNLIARLPAGVVLFGRECSFIHPAIKY